MGSNERLVVDVTDVILRLHCKCGAAISVVPAKITGTVFMCANCTEFWPGVVQHGIPRTAAERLAFALRDIQNEAHRHAGDEPRYRVQFEIERERPRDDAESARR